MPEIGEEVAIVIGNQAQDPDEEKEERKCPVCGAVWKKLEPTLGQVRRAIQEEFVKFSDKVKALHAAGQMGYRGSVAVGLVGNEKKPHYGQEPDIRGECGTKYDVDGFLISSKLHAKIPKDDRGRCWGSRSPDVRLLQREVKDALTARAELAHMKNEFGFRVWKLKDQGRLAAGGAIIVVQ